MNDITGGEQWQAENVDAVCFSAQPNTVKTAQLIITAYSLLEIFWEGFFETFKFRIDLISQANVMTCYFNEPGVFALGVIHFEHILVSRWRLVVNCEMAVDGSTVVNLHTFLVLVLLILHHLLISNCLPLFDETIDVSRTNPTQFVLFFVVGSSCEIHRFQ